MKSVAIVGGGITGLTAAFRLKQNGIPVTLYEATNRAGGVIQSIRENGYLAEFGPNTILETSPQITALIRDLGLESRRLDSDSRAANRYLVRGKKALGLPGSPVGFAKTPLFSLGAKLRIFREPFIRRAAPDVEESLAQFVLRRLGQEFLDYAINPLVAGVYAGAPERLSVKHAFPKLWALEQRYGSLILGQVLGARERKRQGAVSKQNAKKVSFDQGLQVLIEALQARLSGEIRFLSTVRRLVRQGNGWKVTVDADGGEVQFEHSAVLLAAPAHKMADIQAQAAERIDLSSFSKIHYPPVASVVLGYRRSDVPHPLDGFGMLIPEKEKFNSLGALFSSSLFPNRAPEGNVVLTSYVGGARAPALALEPPEKLFRLVAEDLSVILGIKGAPTFRHMTLYPKAIPQYEVGYGRFKELMDRAEQNAPGLFFAGHFRDGISLGDSIVSAHTAAQKLQAFLQSMDGKSSDLKNAA